MIAVIPSAATALISTGAHLVKMPQAVGEYKAKMLHSWTWMRGRKRVLLIAAAILAARKLAQFEGGKRARHHERDLRCDPMG
jgi:hypothetical protein